MQTHPHLAEVSQSLGMEVQDALEGEEQGSGCRSRAGAAFYPLQSRGLVPCSQFRQGTKLPLKRKIGKMERCRAQQVWAHSQEQPPHPKLLTLPTLPSPASVSL